MSRYIVVEYIAYWDWGCQVEWLYQKRLWRRIIIAAPIATPTPTPT